MRTAIYARVSSEAQANRGTIASQLEALTAKVAEVGDEIVARFVDDGYSGARLDRPGLDDLRDQADRGNFERVWCLSPDRLARNFAYQVLVLDELARLGVEVRFTDAPPIDDDPQARLLTQMQGVIAEYERAKNAERERRGKLFRVRAGEAIFWKVPYGYRRIPRSEAGPPRLEVYQPEAAVIRRIFDDYVAGGYSMRQIAKRLYTDGIASPSGKPVWPSSTLGPLLRNSTYAGTAYWYQHETILATRPGGRPRTRLRPREDWIAVSVPAIVTVEIFEAAQRIAAENSAFSPRRAATNQWLLRRLVVCGPCGVHCSSVEIGSSSSPNAKNRYYHCPHHDPLKAGGSEHRCTQQRIRADELDAFVFDQIRAAMLQPELLTAGEAALAGREPIPDDELLAAQLARLTRQVDTAEAERRRLVDCYQAGLIELAELTRRAEELKTRQTRLQTQRDELVAQRGELATNNRLQTRVGDFAARVAAGMDNLDFTCRQRLMRLVLEEVRVTGWQVEIRLRIPLDQPANPTPTTKQRPRSTHTPRSSHNRRQQSGKDDNQEVSSKDVLRSVLGDPPGDAEHPVIAFFDVLAGDQRQQLSRIAAGTIEPATVEHGQRGQRVAHQGIHQLLAGLRIVPVTRRLADARVVVVAPKRHPHPHRHRTALQHSQYLADRRAQLGHRVLGRHRVIDRCGIQHPHPPAHHPRLTSHDLGVVQEPLRPPRGPQPVALADQHRRMERLIANVDPGRGLPTQIALEPVARLAVGQTLMGLEHHHRRQHPRRHRRPATT
jgi:site-specific DNA recombinase